MNWIKERLAERSTYRGLTLITGAFGWLVAPGALEAIGAGVLSALGIIESAVSDKK